MEEIQAWQTNQEEVKDLEYEVLCGSQGPKTEVTLEELNQQKSRMRDEVRKVEAYVENKIRNWLTAKMKPEKEPDEEEEGENCKACQQLELIKTEKCLEEEESLLNYSFQKEMTLYDKSEEKLPENEDKCLRKRLQLEQKIGKEIVSQVEFRQSIRRQ